MKKLLEIPIAHRGLHGKDCSENSLAAFEGAARAGYAIETDVRFTKDGQIAVFHDDDLKRMTGDCRAVSDCTMEELRALRLPCGERIPTLAELLGAADGAPLLIEIKNMKGVSGEKIARALADGMKGYAGEYAVQSFQPFYVKAYQKLCPKVPCGLLAKAHYGREDFSGAFKGVQRRLLESLRIDAWLKADFLSFLFSDYPTRGTERFKGSKLAWTVRSSKDEAVARRYADNIIFENYLP